MSIKVLFICLGNICRSPMAEALLQKHLQEAGVENKISVDSAGLGDWHAGSPPHKGTIGVLEQHGIHSGPGTARVVQSGEEADYIVAMDEQNLEMLQNFHVSAKDGRVWKLLDFHPERRSEDVPDPYFDNNFGHVFELVNTSTFHLLQWIREQENV
ncbi:low molecular weight protein-tyrosine-phosphatase [Marinococcus luteus]|uniref:low molecular weight protein-tyrosine-phosphatase n=1 Tax=Marinococcus luteus TaxID=1122204 RepID=UPI002ACCE322|nr:low molecular weight protein-tyrosine-phosphatase [Marinococcus luteus]MDZ5783046.1 low molecular weight protein-tyrosine-phosphatase [Marinococcus luteus]